jgi:hypothetical protein
MGKQGNT